MHARTARRRANQRYYRWLKARGYTVPPAAKRVVECRYYKREFGHYAYDGKPIDLRGWAMLTESKRYDPLARAGNTIVGPYWVSTVWIGIDYSFGVGPDPLFWETMIFRTGAEHDSPDPLHHWCMRTPSRRAAERLHARIVAKLERRMGVAAIEAPDPEEVPVES